MRKKILAPLLLLALLLSLAVPALAAGPEVRLTASTNAPEAGEEFELCVELVNNPGVYVIQLELQYDPDVLECLGSEKGELLDGMLCVVNTATPGTAIVAAASVDPSEQDGPVLTLRFRAARELQGSAFRLVETLFGDEDGAPYSVTVVGPGAFSAPSGGDAPAETTPPSSPVPTTVPTTAPTAAPQPAFSDIAGHWGEDFILRAAELGLFQGYADGSFGPDKPVTRAQFVTVLYRMSGSPAVTEEAPFRDTSGLIEEFRRAIAWAYGAGYVSGKGNDLFDPLGSITRQEAMKILFALHGGYGGLEQMFTETYDKAFADSGEIADWAKSAMYWAYYNALINGTGEDTLSPKGTATRAQLAKILVNYVEKFQ